MPHFFITTENVDGNKITIGDKENYNHIAKSLRARVGEFLLFIDDTQTEYETVIETISSCEIVSKIENSYKSKRKLDFNLFLAQSPLRSDAQSMVIEKATELGVKGVYPVYTDNCALNKSIIEKKIPKWNRIMYEASKQCERADIPVTFDWVSIKKLLNDNNFEKVIAFCERMTDISLHDYILENPIIKGDNVLVIIGPEGGFSQKEFQFFKDEKIPMITLGNLILKAETAVIVGLGNIIYEYENYRKN